MTRPLVDQPTVLPTRKLTVALIVGAVASIVLALLPDVLRTPEMHAALEALISAALAALAGWLTRDRANVLPGETLRPWDAM